MQYCSTILETIGNTPLLRLNVIAREMGALVLAKMETFNPGHSTKDRIAIKMIEDAELDGRLLPNGTIIEATSGNTGMGLALGAIVKGYKLICVVKDKLSKAKINILQAAGVKVIICPSDVANDDPMSYRSVATRLTHEIPNAWYVNQYDNLSNRQAHYEQTGPEIWHQTQGQITHFVAGVGSGGTISGIGKFLKEKNASIKIWGVDTYGSCLKKYHETTIVDKNEIYPFLTEGIGEDIIPDNINFSVIDGFTKVTDKDAAIYTRKLLLEEGMFVGWSSGAVMKGVLQLQANFNQKDVVVMLVHDHGTRYMEKVFNDDWMRQQEFLE